MLCFSRTASVVNQYGERPGSGQAHHPGCYLWPQISDNKCDMVVRNTTVKQQRGMSLRDVNI